MSLFSLYNFFFKKDTLFKRNSKRYAFLLETWEILNKYTTLNISVVVITIPPQIFLALHLWGK